MKLNKRQILFKRNTYLLKNLFWNSYIAEDLETQNFYLHSKDASNEFTHDNAI